MISLFRWQTGLMAYTLPIPHIFPSTKQLYFRVSYMKSYLSRTGNNNTHRNWKPHGLVHTKIVSISSHISELIHSQKTLYLLHHLLWCSVWTGLQFNSFNGKLIFRESTLQGPLWGRQQITRLGSHLACDSLNISAVPLQLLWLLSQPNCHIRYANSGELIACNSIKSCRIGHILRDHFPVVDIFNLGNRFTIPFIVWVWPVIACHPEDILHGLHGHFSSVDVLHIASPSHACFDPHAGLGIYGCDVFSSDVLDPARHLAAQSDDGAVGGYAGEPPDDYVPGWDSILDPVLVPATLYCNAVIAWDYVTVLDFHVCAWIWRT